jgi:hypothetical protein
VIQLFCTGYLLPVGFVKLLLRDGRIAKSALHIYMIVGFCKTSDPSYFSALLCLGGLYFAMNIFSTFHADMFDACGEV